MQKFIFIYRFPLWLFSKCAKSFFSMNILRIGIFSALLSLTTFCQALPETEWRPKDGVMVGTFKGLPPTGEPWAPSCQGLPTKAVLHVPPFPLNRDISAADVSMAGFYEIWCHLPSELRNLLQRLGVAEERGRVVRFLKLLRIAYSFHSVSSLPKKFALATVDTKLSKPYLLACQPGENVASLQCVCPYDEEKSPLRCCRFPGGYLLRNTTGNVADNSFYAFDITGRPSLTSAMSFLFVSSDARTKALSCSLSFHIFVDSVIALDAYALDRLMLKFLTPSRESQYGDAGIKEALAFHKKIFPDLFPLLAYNVDLTKALNACCFGSLLDLEALLSMLRNLPASRLFIADGNMRSRCSSLRVTLEEEGVVPIIDIAKLRREPNGQSVVQDAEKYNLFAKALWGHVYSAIVRDMLVFDQDVCSVEEAKDGYVLDEGVAADRRLLSAAQTSACDQLKVLSIVQSFSEKNYFGPQYVILPETARDTSDTDRPKMHHLIAHLYQHSHDRIMEMGEDQIKKFLIDVKQKSEVNYRRKVDLQHLENYLLAEDTEDGKYSCTAVVPPEFRSLSGLEVKTRFAKALLSGLRVLFSPLKDGALEPIDMQIPDNIYDSYGLLDSKVTGSVQRVIATYFRESYDVDSRSNQPAHYIYGLLSLEPSQTTDDWRHLFTSCLRQIKNDIFSGFRSVPAPGIFFNPAIACFIISKIQVLADACLTQKNLAQIQDKVECLLDVFQIISQRFDFVCETGRFEGMLLLFMLLVNDDPSIAALPVRCMADVFMKITIEKRFAEIFKAYRSFGVSISVDPHSKMTFREALSGAYGIDGKEPEAMFGPPKIYFVSMLRAAQAHGVDVSSIRGYQHDYPYPITPEATAKCRELMRLIMSPVAVLDALLENELCRYVLEKFLREEHHLSDDQISVLLRNADIKRQIMADILEKYGYLKPKS
jgi:hypothetical protein